MIFQENYRKTASILGVAQPSHGRGPRQWLFLLHPAAVNSYMHAGRCSDLSLENPVDDSVAFGGSRIDLLVDNNEV